MLQCGLKSKTGIKIGALLIRSGVVTPDAITTALEQSRRQDRPIGSVLVKLSMLRQQDLSSALYLQALLHEGILDLDTAVRALNYSYRYSMGAKDALQVFNWTPKVETRINPICQLMLSSGFLSQQLYEELARQEQPLAFSFVLRGVLTCSQFNEILRVYSLINQNVITEADGIAALKVFRDKWIPCFQTLAELGTTTGTNPIRLGEILIAAGAIGDVDLLSALERSLNAGVKIGDVLVDSKLVDSQTLQDCLDAQQLIITGVLDKERGITLARNAYVHKLPVREIVKTTGILAHNDGEAMVIALLNEAQVTTNDAIVNALNDCQSFGMGALSALAFSGSISPDLYDAARHCERKLSTGRMRADEAIVILQICDRLNCTFDEAAACTKAEAFVERKAVEEPSVMAQPEIYQHCRDTDRETRSNRNVVLFTYLAVAAVVLAIGYVFQKQFVMDFGAPLAACWLVFCFRKLGAWERQDRKRSEDIELTVAVAQRVSGRHKSSPA